MAACSDQVHVGGTTTRPDCGWWAELDTNPYQARRHIPDDELETIYLRKNPFHGVGNYALVPRQGLGEFGLIISWQA